MTIRIEAYLADYDLDPEHSTDGRPGFQHQVIFVDCTECPSLLPMQFPSLEATLAWGEHHAAVHYWRDKWGHRQAERPEILETP